MGRTRTKKQAHTKASNPPAQRPTPPSIKSLLEKSQSLIVQCDYELALRFIHRILEQDPKNAEAKEMLGVALLETGETEKAKLVSFSFCIETSLAQYFYRRSNPFCLPIQMHLHHLLHRLIYISHN